MFGAFIEVISGVMVVVETGDGVVSVVLCVLVSPFEIISCAMAGVTVGVGVVIIVVWRAVEILEEILLERRIPDVDCSVVTTDCLFVAAWVLIGVVEMKSGVTVDTAVLGGVVTVDV